ncbi:MAG: dibenzothiophene desulfurase [Albidovulum sp.]|uniref:dimethyl sulfoxide reductase anchor subunit family protein n=1 Tax=Albidovulum sp. TaxID=1872424 RepID=UPI0013227E31|nr:DmsC/YnfH family molybdoenzyme membrane anchor subunit [Defluviimonas sp.]KAB2884848.1 MAG: dibenzothiophene desulfurase [Defluviimonas sp.]
MHPAPSVILFTTLSGAGFGLLFVLASGAVAVFGLEAVFLWGLGYLLAVVGLLASTFHLGRPERAILAFSQWRTSWLSREAWASAGAILMLAPVALAAVFGGGLPPAFGLTGALACLLALLSTGMIYAQLRTVPRWNHWTTPALFFVWALAGGTILAGLPYAAALLCAALAVLQLAAWRSGDTRFAARGHRLATATGLGSRGDVRSFAPPHTAGNYVMREMIHVVGRRHAVKLRALAILLGAVLPAILVVALPSSLPAHVLAFAVHFAGALAARWLFFAEAEHVVGLFYGAR